MFLGVCGNCGPVTPPLPSPLLQLYPLLGDVMTIPGLSTRPGYFDVDLDMETGKIVGLF